MNGSPNQRKVLLFGFLGASGCLVGWLVGEMFLLVSLPASTEKGGSLVSKPSLPPLARVSTPPAPPPALPVALALTRGLAPVPSPPIFPDRASRSPTAPAPPPAEFADRLEKAGAKTGDVQITLIWFNVNDLDLHCVDPAGDEIFYARRRSRSGGELDVDMNASGPVTNRPVENIYWPKGKAPEGKYKVYVNHYANHGGVDPTKYKVSVLVDGRREEYTGEITFTNRQPRPICEFEVKSAEPEMQLAVSPELIVYQGDKNQLKVRVARGNAAGDVSCRINGDVDGISPRKFTIPANETEATVDIASDASARLGMRKLDVSATAANLQTKAQFLLSIKEPPPVLRLAVSPEVIVNQGGSNRLGIRVARTNLTAPVRVRVEGDLQGVSAREFTLGAGETETTAEIQAEGSALPGERVLRIIASAGDTQADASFRLSVKMVPPLLRLGLPSEIQITQGGKNELPVRIARDRFVGPVTIRLEGDLVGVPPQEFTINADRDAGEMILSADNADLGTRDIQVTATGSGVRAEGKLQLIVVAPAGRQWSWRLVFVIGLWTAFLAMGLSLALVMGQNWYLARPLLSLNEAAILMAGSLVAGVIAGGVGQALYGLLTWARLVPEIGFLAGWLLLGSLLGRGVVFFVPNLNSWRATGAGSCGGFLGACAFIAVSFVGDVAGRLMGAAILGFALGLMVALVETAFRKVWLEVVYGPGVVRAVNLGATPVLIGGDGRKCTVLVAGAPGKALKFWESNGQVYCLDVLAENTYPVSPGYRHRLKQAEVMVCSNDKGAKAPSLPLHSKSPAPPPAIPSQAPRPAVIPIGKLVSDSNPKPASSPKVSRPSTASTSRLIRPVVEPQTTPQPAGPVKAPCPVCGDHAKGLPGKRRCANCSTVF